MLRTLYAHPPRAYHNLDHIANLLVFFDEVRALAEERDCLEFAVWLHDCVYFAERPDNEERSADAAAMIAGLLGCTPEFTARVRSLIAVTRHSVPPPRGDWSLIADIDLSILGAPWDGPGGYDDYRRAIRREFAFATDQQFRDGRTAFVQRMLDRPSIYHTAYFTRKLERAACDNLNRELDLLQAGP
jgi:predicted metal-dependent HD superfamily phosphohydrolase